MAFEYAGNMRGLGSPIVRPMQVSADCYVGQLLMADAGTGGNVLPAVAVLLIKETRRLMIPPKPHKLLMIL
jgi:hypothetical protein